MPETKDQMIGRFPDNHHQLIEPDDLRALATVVYEHFDDLTALRTQVTAGKTGTVLPSLPLTLANLRHMELNVAYPLPSAAIPHVAGIPVIPGADSTSRIDLVGLSAATLGYRVRDAFVVRWSPDTWVLLGRKLTGSPVEEPVWFMLVADSSTSDATVVGVGLETFHSATDDLARQIGPMAALGSGISLVHHIASLEARILNLEAKDAAHVPVAAIEAHYIADLLSGILFADCDTDVPYDGHEHIVDFAWKDGTKPDLGMVSSGLLMRDHSQAHTSRMHTVDGEIAGPNIIDLFVSSHSRVTVKWEHDVINIVQVEQAATT